MRAVCLVLVALLPSVAWAQAPLVGAVDVAGAPATERLDVTKRTPLDFAPMMSEEQAIYVLLGAILAGVAAASLAQGATCGETALGTLGCGLAMAAAWSCTRDNVTEPHVAVASGAAYPVAALQAYEAGRLTAVDRRALAAAARVAGQDGVVLQRLARVRGGVGSADAGLTLELAVVDAETAALRPFGGDALAPQTTLALPVEPGIAEAVEEALAAR